MAAYAYVPALVPLCHVHGTLGRTHNVLATTTAGGLRTDSLSSLLTPATLRAPPQHLVPFFSDSLGQRSFHPG